MKIAFRILALLFFAVWMSIFYSCKKNSDIPTVVTTPVSLITATTAASGGTVTDNGGAEVTMRGVCWSISGNPTTADSRTSDGIGTGTFSTSLELLTPGTTYLVRAYATNSAGTGYGNQVSFTTMGTSVLATLTTNVVTSIASTSAVSGGTITFDGGSAISAEGVCWGTSADPTISDSKTSNVSDAGDFTSILTGLIPNTTYYVRAYATNTGGVAYGNQLSFTTSAVQGGLWTQKADFPGEARYSAISFSVGSKAYIGLGYNQNDFALKDIWEWDQSTNTWTRKADFPGNPSGAAVCLSIGTKGYIGTGNNFSTNGSTNEFWEYDPASNSWTQKASLPTTPARALAVGFSIGSKGYIGLGQKDSLPVDGHMNYYSDFWEWDQTKDVWTKKADFAGSQREGAVGFSIGDKGYIGTGSDGTNYSREFWEWDQTSNIWTKRADFAGPPTAWAVGISIGNKGYIGAGAFWEWDQSTNVWKEIAYFGGKGRGDVTGFSIGNKGYLGTGTDGSTSYKDLWELTPQ